MLALLFLVATAPSTDAALRVLETEHASAKGKQEKSLEAIEQAIKHHPAKCTRCPVCVGSTLEDIEARVGNVRVIASSLPAVELPVLEVRGDAEVWRTYPPPPVLIGSAQFSAPFATPPQPLKATTPPAVPLWLWIAGAGFLGIAAGVAVTGAVMSATR